MQGLIAALALWLAVTAPAFAQHAGHPDPTLGADRPPACQDPSLSCATVAAPAFDGRGRLWVAWSQPAGEGASMVFVARSDDLGATFAAPVAVTPKPVAVDDNGENRPKVIDGRNGRFYVSFTVRGEKRFTGNVMLSRSGDDGVSFSEPVSVSDEAEIASLRFESLAVAPDGRLTVAWLDKRDLDAAKATETGYTGAAVYFATSDDGGVTFAPNRAAQHHTCECCRTAMAMDGDLPVVVWRNIFGANVRDHALMRFDAPDRPGPARRISQDDWAIDACPHHGPAVAVEGPGVYHVTWFTDGAARQGSFYARSEDGGITFSPAMALGDPDNNPAHAHVAALGSSVALGWKEFDGARTSVMVMTSADGGRTWSRPWVSAVAAAGSDHPLLVADGRRIYLSWQTAAEGYRLIPITGQGAAGGLIPFDANSFAGLVGAAPSGPLAVVFWSLDCAVCIADLPHWRALGDRRPDLRLAFVAADRPDRAARARAVLAANGLDAAEAWIFADAFAEPIRRAVDRSWRGVLPRVDAFGPGGRKTFMGRLDEAALLSWLDGTRP